MSDETQTEIATLPETQKLAAVVDKAESGDEVAVPALRRFIQDTAGLACVSRCEVVERSMRWMAGTLAVGDSARKDTIIRQAEQMGIDLAGDDPTPLETVMVQRIVACWLRLQIAEINAGTCGSDPQTEFFQRQLERSHRMFLSAVKTLATVRRLASPLNLNLAIGVTQASETRSIEACRRGDRK